MTSRHAQSRGDGCGAKKPGDAKHQPVAAHAPITERAIVLMETLALGHGLQMGDALIAATALEHGLPVLTANTKHFSAIEGLTIEVFVP